MSERRSVVLSIHKQLSKFYGEGLLSVPGIGLGLAITKEVLDRHSGRVTLESEVDSGSRFSIWLPIDPSY